MPDHPGGIPTVNIKSHLADAFLADPPDGLRAVLLYGPDGGLVNERGRGLIRRVAGSLDDPFRVVELSRRDLESDPARLADELGALSLTGGRRAVRLRDAADGFADGIEAAVAASPGDSLLVVEAGELPGRSALRKLFEGGAALAAVPCYRDDERSLPAVIRGVLKEHGFGVAEDALDYLARNLGGDRLVTRRELEKLALYKTGEEGGSRTVTLSDAENCIGDTADITLEDLCYAVAGGDPVGAERAFGRAMAEGVAAVSLVRALARHFERLHLTAGAISDGLPVDAAVGRLRPPIFWKRKQAFQAQAGTWPEPRLRDAIEELTELEVSLKSGQAEPELLASRALLRLTVNAPKRRSGGGRR